MDLSLSPGRQIPSALTLVWILPFLLQSSERLKGGVDAPSPLRLPFTENMLLPFFCRATFSAGHTRVHMCLGSGVPPIVDSVPLVLSLLPDLSLESPCPWSKSCPFKITVYSQPFSQLSASGY